MATLTELARIAKAKQEAEDKERKNIQSEYEKAQRELTLELLPDIKQIFPSAEVPNKLKVCGDYYHSFISISSKYLKGGTYQDLEIIPLLPFEIKAGEKYWVNYKSYHIKPMTDTELAEKVLMNYI